MLYHYTDFAAFDGIIRCGELRLNNILNMNDASEMRLFMNGICRAVCEKLRKNDALEKSRKLEAFFRKEMEEEFHYSAGTTLPIGKGTDIWVRVCALLFTRI